MEEDVRWLDRGWSWLAEHEGHADHERMLAAWVQRLRWYEEAMRLTGRAE